MKSRLTTRSRHLAPARIAIALVLAGCALAEPPNPCPTCTIELTPVATLGDEDDSVSIDYTATARRMARGDFVAGSLFESTVVLYDSTGAQRSVYRRPGRGPGELADVSAIAVGPGDTVYVADGTNHRIAVLSPSLEFVREFTSPIAAADLAILPDGRILIEGHHPTDPDRIHLVSAEGEPLRSFAADPVVPRPFGERPSGGAMAAAITGDAVWLAARNRLDVDRWTLAGERAAHLRARARWFEPWDSIPARAIVEMRPFSLVTVIQHSVAHDVLWLVAIAPDSTWKPSPSATGAGEHALAPATEFIDEVLRARDAIIAAIDPTTGAVIASYRSPDVLGAFAAPDLITRPRRTPEGGWAIDVLELQLKRH